MKRQLPQRRCKAYYIKPEEPESTENTENPQEQTEKFQNLNTEENEEQPAAEEQITLPQVLFTIYGAMAGLDIIKLNVKNGKITDYTAVIGMLHLHHTVINIMTERFYSTSPETQNTIVKEANLELLRKRSEIYNILNKKVQMAMRQNDTAE